MSDRDFLIFSHIDQLKTFRRLYEALRSSSTLIWGMG
jgi:hypothetical protein